MEQINPNDDIPTIIEKLEIEQFRRDSNASVLKRHQENVSLGQDFWQEFYNRSREDTKFFNGDEYNNYQWHPNAIKARNEPENERPMITMNQLPSLLKYPYGRMIANPPDVSIVAAMGAMSGGKFESNGGVKLNYTDLIGGLWRKAWYDCQAEKEVQKLLKHTLVSGFGWLRLKRNFISDSNFDRTLAVECIDERWDVMIDPACKDQNYGDADWAVIRHRMSYKDFKKRYGEKSPPMTGSSWFGTMSAMEDRKYVRQVFCDEYFERIMVPTLLLQYETNMSSGKKKLRKKLHDNKAIAAFIKKLYAEGGRATRYRKFETPVVNWYRVGGKKILEFAKWPGTRIPLVFVPGREFQTHNSKRTYKGMFTEAREAQRFYNFFISQMVEAMVTSVKQGWLISAEQLAGNEDSYKKTGMYEQVTYTFTDVGLAGGSATPPPQLVGGAFIPEAELTVMSGLRSMIMELSGVTEADMGLESNTVSGVAQKERKEQGAVGTMEFLNNAFNGVKSITRAALEVMPHFYKGNDVLYIMDIREDPDSIDVPPDWGTEDFMLNTESMVIRVTGGNPHTTLLEAQSEYIAELIKQGNPAWLPMFMHQLTNQGVKLADDLKWRMMPLMDRRSLTESEIKELDDKPQPPMTNEQQLEMAKAEAMKLQAQATIMEAEMRKGEMSPEARKMVEDVVKAYMEKQAAGAEPPMRAR